MLSSSHDNSQKNRNDQHRHAYDTEPSSGAKRSAVPDSGGQRAESEDNREAKGDGDGSSPLCSGGDAEACTGAAVGAVSGTLPSESLPPEVFYSMKLVTGKDAVGTLSGPGTLGIEKCGEGGKGDGAEAGAAAACGAGAEDKRSTVRRTLTEALSWGKGDGGGREGGVAGCDARAVSPEGEAVCVFVFFGKSGAWISYGSFVALSVDLRRCFGVWVL